MPPKKTSAPKADETAASSRPRRAAAAGPAPVAEPKAAAKPQKATKAAAAEPNVAKKRGRAPKAAVEKEEAEDEDEDEEEAPPPKKKRAAPKKAAVAAAPKTKKTAPAAKKGKAAAVATAPAVEGEEKAAPKKRGRPPKGGETTKIAADDGDAAEQLEGETADAAEGKRGDLDFEFRAEKGRNYWLMKAEQEDRLERTKSGREVNTKFTIDDLRDRGEAGEPWDGVRNVVAAKNMRTMKAGDLAFFYASQGKQGRKPGITGIMEITAAHSPDTSTADPDSYAYVEKVEDRKKWCVVQVAFRKKLRVPITLRKLQDHGKEGGKLSGMDVLRLSRLSVSRVGSVEWNFIVGTLVEGYEGEDEDAS